MDTIDLDELVKLVIDNRKYMTPTQVSSIANTFASANPSARTLGVDIDLLEEIQVQLRAVQTLRGATVSSSGSIVGSVKEAKEALTTATQLLKLLLDMQKEVMTIARRRAVEQAVVETLTAIDPALQQEFLEKLAKRLEHEV